MTVLMDDSHALDEELIETLDSLELPPGYRAEIIERQIIAAPPPSIRHEGCVAEISYQLATSRHGWRCSGNLGVITPLGRFIPDLTVAPKSFFERDSIESWQHPKGIALVCEITSNDPSRDREPKRRGYASAGIPLHLLIDRSAKESTLFSEPTGGDYRVNKRRTLGDDIEIPEPFSITLIDIG